MSDVEPTTAATSEPQNTAAQTEPAPAEAPVKDDVAPTEVTSEANETAVAVDAPALPPPNSDNNEEHAGKEIDLDMKAADTAEGEVSGATVVAPSGDDVSTATKQGGSKDKRRSSAGIPEHKSKKLNKKKSMPELQMDAKPGDYYWAKMKGYPPWPAIICDEEMLPESLLQTRPVTAMKPDGTYRDDYQKGGKNARDRTYAVMYLGTNEFSWTPNVDLKPLEFAEVENAVQGKKIKVLWAAYQLAKERHELQHYKDLLAEHEQALREEAEEIEKRELEEAEKAEKKATKDKRKSKSADDEVADDEDVDMDEVEGEVEDGAKKAKPSKKRKKEAESEGEGAKPAKTPKTKLKVNLSKSAEGEASATKSKSKPKAAKAKDSPKTPQLSEEEKRQKREKEVLYFRHKLQKGFLSSDSPPQESEMKQMADHFTALEAHTDLEQSIIKTTKIHKVLKAILKLASIPKDEEFKFKERSMSLLQKWQKILSEGADEIENSVVEKTTNGEAEGADGEATKEEVKEKKEDEEMETPAEVAEPAEAPVETKKELGNSAGDEATDGDVDMTDSKADATYEPPATDAAAAEDAEVKTTDTAVEETKAE